jgi:alpha-beta hydrolase superfamily lysophospholipase
MRTIRLQVTIRCPAAAQVTIVASAHLPDRTPARLVVVAVPGGGYNREYFDLRPGPPGYSQAEHHTDRGVCLLAVDPVGVGESTAVAGLGLAEVATTNAAAVRELLIALGTALGARPPVTIGIGHSMGAAIITMQQAHHESFDAVGVLGWSAVHTRRPAMPGAADNDSVEAYRWAYHFETEPPAVVAADIGRGYPQRSEPVPAWGSPSRPFPAAVVTGPRVVAAEAADIGVPVLIACGERDVVPDPQREPFAYVRSPDVAVTVVRDMAHLHNFANSRRTLWDRLSAWYERVAGGPAT